MTTLYVVGTPIGNLEDITLRALRVLRDVDLIACEDTRQTRKLLQRHGIVRPLIAYHDHNEQERTPVLIERLRRGERIALVTDAGTPGISDPGYHLVRMAAEEGLGVEVIPGPSAVTAALSVAGLPTDRFLFLGFLPRAAAARRRALQDVKAIAATLVIFEAPHRIRRTLHDLADVLGPRQIALVREVTKIHEEVIRGAAAEVAAKLGDEPRGEITLVVQGANEAGRTGRTVAHGGDQRQAAVSAAAVDTELRRLVAHGWSRRDAARQVSERYGIPRRVAYRLVTERPGR